MAIVFPSAKDNFTNPSGASLFTDVDHALQHSNANDAIEAIEDALGYGTTAGQPFYGFLFKNGTAGRLRWKNNAGNPSAYIEQRSGGADTLDLYNTDGDLNLNVKAIVIDSQYNTVAAAGDPTLIIKGDDNKERIELRSYGGASFDPTFQGYSARGTEAAPTQSLTSDIFVSVGGRGTDNTGARELNRAGLIVLATENHTTTNQGTCFQIYTTSNASTTRTNRWRVNHNGDLLPEADNTYYIGGGSNRPVEIYAMNATINTSDPNEKRDISEIPVGIDFLKKLDSIRWRWKDYDQEYEAFEPEEYTDEKGEKQIREKKVIKKIEHRHHRYHYGWSAAQLKEVLDEEGIDTEDFAAYIEDSGKLGIRSGELLPIATKAIGEVDDKVIALQQEVSELKTLVESLTARIESLEAA